MTNLTSLELAAVAVAVDEEGEGGLHIQHGVREKRKENLTLFTKN
jgi:hypothetical protein